MRMLLITQDFSPSIGGVARYYAGLLSALSPDDVTVLAPLPAYADAHPYRVLRRRFYTRWVWPHWLPLLWHAWRAIRSVKPDEVWVGHVLPIGTVVWLLRRFQISNLKYVIFCHGMDILVPQSSARKTRLMRRVLSGAARVVANSTFVRDELLTIGVSGEKITIVHPCADLHDASIGVGDTEFRAQQALTGKTILLTVARLVPRKGVDLVLKALRSVTVSNLVYVIVGGGPERVQLEQYAIRNKLPARFIGEVSDDELASWYTACDVFIMTPRRIGPDVEGFGMVYLEAGQYGKPCIGTRSGGVADAVVDGETGLLVDEDDVEGLTAALRRLLTDPELRTRFGAHARARIEREFRWSHQLSSSGLTRGSTSSI